ncbi:unnamed protein product [Brassicogethes aeneus]|uniref:Uncharacterized protein n=1 Tax=Brassicogethes aeneus TaxID=1431903 RepID=A0A9P0B948_BRAAE|nr:unnamed protein product [Brassicogethes aeneus]
MKLDDFFIWPDNSSMYKLTHAEPRPYMKDIVEVTAERGKYILTYKTGFDTDNTCISLDFLSKNASRQLHPPPDKANPRGITRERKKPIEKNLFPIIPTSRRLFWESLPVNDNAADLRVHYNNL